MHFTRVFTRVSFSLHYALIMKCEVQLFIAGHIVKETMIARDYSHAKEIATARFPNTTILGVTAIFDKEVQ